MAVAPPGYASACRRLCFSGFRQPLGPDQDPYRGTHDRHRRGVQRLYRGGQIPSSEGEGYVSIRRYRNRHFGHPELLRLVAGLGHTMARRGSELVMVGDLSQPRGGLMSSSHRSHQNGLDVDIWFMLAPSVAVANRDTAGPTDPPSMVSPDSEGLSPLWGEDQRYLLKTAAEDPRTDRIFVNAAIKRGLCRREVDKGWLRKVRPWFGHDAHFHIRLKCPQDGSQCETQAAIPAGDGCGKDLEWWFSEEARNPKKRGAGARAEPVMPTACKPLLSGN